MTRKIFISYRREPDAGIANYLAEILNQHDLEAYLDVNKLKMGAPFPAQLARAIEACDFFVVLLNIDTLDSDWVQREIEQAYQHGKVMVPIFIYRYAIPHPNTYSEAIQTLISYQGEIINNVTMPEDVQRLADKLLTAPLRSRVVPTSATSKMAILIVDDSEVWRDLIQETVEMLPNTTLDLVVVGYYDDAMQAILTKQFDLFILDKDLQDKENRTGLDLLKEIRDSALNCYAAAIILTAFGTVADTKFAHQLQVDDFLEKGKAGIDATHFIAEIPSYLRQARLRAAEAKAQDRRKLEFYFEENKLVSVIHRYDNDNRLITRKLIQPNIIIDDIDIATEYHHLRHAKDDAYSRRRRLGKDIYRQLFNNVQVNTILTEAQAFTSTDYLRFDFICNDNMFNVPFELLNNDAPDLCLRYPLALHFAESEGIDARSFRRFIADNQSTMVNVLLVSSDNTRDEEIDELEVVLKQNIANIGLEANIMVLKSQSASAEVFRQILQSNENLHFLHYAGPSNANLIFNDGTVALDELEVLLLNPKLRLLYLSQSIASDNENQTDSFAAMMRCSVRARIPATVSYRRPLNVDLSRITARQFYQALWRSLSVSEAALKVRNRLLREKSQDAFTLLLQGI